MRLFSLGISKVVNLTIVSLIFHIQTNKHLPTNTNKLVNYIKK
jgi:hypothetical protein